MKKTIQLHLDEKIYHLYHPIHVYTAICLCSGGVLMNLCMIMVLAKRKMRSATNTILLSIATIEIVLMLMYLTYLAVFELLSEKCWFEWRTLATAYFNLVYADLSVVMRACSLWLTVLMAGLRYRIIQKPHSRHIRTPVAVALICAVLTAVAIFATPIYFLHQVNRHEVPKSIVCWSGEYYVIEISDIGLRSDGLLVQIACWTNGLFFKLLPCCGLVYYLCRLGYYLYTYGRQREILQSPRNIASNLEVDNDLCYSNIMPATTPNGSYYHSVAITLSSQAKRKASGLQQLNLRSSTLILTIIMVVTLVLETPNALFSIFWALALAYKWQRGMEIYMNLGDIFDLFALLTGVFTFPLYCAMSGDFRKHFVQFFCACKKRK